MNLIETTKNGKMETKMYRDSTIRFYRNGKQVFDFTIKGNIVMFSNGDYFLI